MSDESGGRDRRIQVWPLRSGIVPLAATAAFIVYGAGVGAFGGVGWLLAAQETVPIELVRAMVGDDAELLIGELPPEVGETLLLPQGARVIGAVRNDDRSTSYLIVDGNPAATIAFFRDQKTAEGWRVPEERQQARGFQRPSVEVHSVTLCGPTGELLSVSSGPGASMNVRIQHYPRFPGMLPCDRPSRDARVSPLEERMPVLEVPPEEFQRNTMMGGSDDARWSGVELRSERGASQIAADLVGSLESEGWEPGFSTGNDEVAVQVWNRTFEDGFRARGMLTVLQRNPGVFDAMFRLIRSSP